LTDFCDHELLSLHELLAGTALQSKMLKAHMTEIQDPELKTIARNALKSQKEFVDKVSSILK